MNSSFTTTCRGIANVLINSIFISSASILNSSNNNINNEKHKYTAIWDTGATGTVISQRVIDECGLIPTGMTQVATAGGIVSVGTYIVDVSLPNNVTFHNLNVTSGNLNGTDVLIGMDIISAGDFSVSNFNGKTKFTFRIPSQKDADFVEESKQERTIHAENKPNRNSKCPCGSGKKYKNCCGKNG